MIACCLINNRSVQFLQYSNSYFFSLLQLTCFLLNISIQSIHYFYFVVVVLLPYKIFTLCLCVFCFLLFSSRICVIFSLFYLFVKFLFSKIVRFILIMNCFISGISIFIIIFLVIKFSLCMSFIGHDNEDSSFFLVTAFPYFSFFSFAFDYCTLFYFYVYCVAYYSILTVKDNQKIQIRKIKQKTSLEQIYS